MNEKISIEDLMAIRSARASLKIAELELSNTILKIFLKHGLTMNDSINELDGIIVKQNNDL